MHSLAASLEMVNVLPYSFVVETIHESLRLGQETKHSNDFGRFIKRKQREGANEGWLRESFKGKIYDHSGHLSNKEKALVAFQQALLYRTRDGIPSEFGHAWGLSSKNVQKIIVKMITDGGCLKSKGHDNIWSSNANFIVPYNTIAVAMEHTLKMSFTHQQNPFHSLLMDFLSDARTEKGWMRGSVQKLHGVKNKLLSENEKNY